MRYKNGGQLFGARLAALALLNGLGGCGLIEGAQSYPVAGAYFPGWLVCLTIGVLSATFYRVLFLHFKIDAILRFRLLTYLSLGAVTGLLFWVIFFAS